MTSQPGRPHTTHSTSADPGSSDTSKKKYREEIENRKRKTWYAAGSPDGDAVSPHADHGSQQAPILFARQSADSSNSSCPSTISGGGIAGIVIGSIAGTLLLMWLWKLCSLQGACGGGDSDHGSVPGRGRRRRARRNSSGMEYVEKSRSRYRNEPRRPSKVYIT